MTKSVRFGAFAALLIAVASGGIWLTRSKNEQAMIQSTPPVAEKEIQAASQSQPAPVAADSASPAIPRQESAVPRIPDERRRRFELEQRQRERERWLAARHAWRKQMEESRRPVTENDGDPGEDAVLVVDDESTPDLAVDAPKLPSIAAVLSSFDQTGNREVAIEQIRQLLDDHPAKMVELATLASQSNGDKQLLMAEGLAAIGSAEAVDELANLILSMPQGDARTDLVEAAAKISNLESAPYLFNVISASGDEDLLQVAQRALANMCDQPLLGEIVARYVQSQDETERDNLLGAIRYIENPSAVPFLAELASLPNTDYEDPLALAVVDTLGIIGTPEAVRVLLSLVDSVPVDRNMPILDAIERISNPESYDLLAAVVQGRQAASVEARLVAMEALARVMSPAIENILRGLLDSDVEEIRQEAAALLGGQP